ncbi:MAG: tetratricopeptide repeat protein, partial [Methylococcales bacterium]|nr:tetratricopeptide repeat protein [Methylococcales bacterium]
HALHLSALLASQRGDWQQTVALINQSLAINPDNAAAYLDLGSAFQELQNFNQALASYDRALALKPDYVEAFYNRGNLFLDNQQFDKAVLSYDSALRLKPNDANALHNRGIALKNLQRYDEAVASYGQALAINPDTQFLFGDWLYLKMSVCNWDNLDRHLDELEQGIAQGKPLSVPFTVLAFSDSIALQKQVAVSYAATKYPSAPLLPLPPKHTHKKIKIGYFSADFYHHATAYLMAELFERHDKARFDIVAFSFSPVNHQDALRLRLENAFDRFINVSQQSDEQVVRLARQLEIDIAIDLKGYTEHSRPNIFAMRAAPIQVNYLGYPSTMGADYMDYLLADTVLIPDKYQAYYSEKIAYLPHSYQVNDAKRVIANKTFTRAELGLPAHGIVFCCFNSNYKITPAVFDSWMRILHEVDGSVLWLLEDNASAVNHLHKEASACGIDPKRLCFAKRMTLAEHLARHRIADLFLDTSPCNAHTTASDALWAGLPVLTCIGDTFAGRVAASLLTAIGLPELITTNLEDYEALAIQLATHPKQLAALKQKLADNRLRYPLFDTALFTQHIEAAYQLMFTRYQADLTPEHIYVPAQAVSKQPPPEVNRTEVKRPPEPAKSSGLFAKLLTGITRRKHKAAENQQADESFTQAEANTFARAQRLHQQGQHAAAEILYEQLLKNQPHHPDLLRCLAALKKLHPQPPIPAPAPPQPAQSNAEQLLAHFNQGLEYQDANRLTDALNSYERVLAIDPHHVDALINRGNVLEDLNRFNDALASYDRAIAARPDYARAHSNRGNVLQSLQRFDEALASYDRALAIQPDYAVAFYNRGNTLQACKRPQDAIQSYQYALAIKPDFIQAVISLGNALHDDQRFDDALSSYDRALIIQPDHAEALYNRGNVLHDLNRYSDAIDSYNRALAIKPDDAGARWNASFCYLILGDFANGWKNYEARWQTDDFKKAARHFSAPQWSGDEALQGKTILLYGEQGLGDTLHFCRYAKLVAALGGRVILEVPKALLPLLAQLEGVEQVIAQGEPLPSFDFHSPLLSLPLAFKTRLDSIPADIPYLFSNPDKVQHWQAVLGAKTLPRVGVVWSGNAAHKNDHNRSIELHKLLPLFMLPCQFISLQKELSDADSALLAQQPRLHHYGAQLIDFSDTAALIELMDVVISVDTSVAHLAAAMGKPTWLLLANNQDWRWLLNRADSPWYPSVRLFRQTQRGNWQTVIAQVQHELGYLSGHNAAIETAQPSAAFQQAVELHQQGQLAQAEMLYQDILRTQPDNADVLHLLGVIAKQQGQAQTAIDLISQSLKINPDNSSAHSNIGLAFQALNRFDEALSSYHRALELNPDHADALFNQGITLQCLNRSEDALASYDRALTVQPDNAETLFNRGVVLQSLKRLEEALASYHRALIIKPDYAQALYGRGIVLSELERFNDALASYDGALAIKPDYVEALSNRGGVLSSLNRFAEALDSYDSALRVRPDDVPALYNRGNVLQDLTRYQEAIDSYNRALIIQPDYAEAHWNAGFCSLLLGDFDNGWQQHEWRWQTDHLKDYVRDFAQPLWLGDTSLQGKTILLHSEQGLGDTVQFCRYAKQVAELGGRVILEVQKPLARLLSHLEGVEQLIVQGDALPAFDFHCPLLSLPLAFKTQLDSIPADTPYLFSAADKVTHWQALLGEKTLPRIGVVWSGSSTHKNDHHRSLPLHELLPLFTTHCQFISLQKELRDADNALLAQQPLLQHYGAQLHDFTDTAALIELMDVVISVDTSVAHLAAAMGKPTWILLADNQDWRWLLNRADSPWYPSVRLFRQTQRGDWQAVIQQVQHALSQLPNYPTDHLNTVEETTPPSTEAVDALINQGNDLEDIGQFDRALACYDRALSLNPDYARAHSNRGNVLQLLQRFTDALISYDRALAVRPDYAEAFFNRGNALRALHRFDEALSSYDKALAIKPEFILALIGRGVVLQDLKRFADALACYDRVLAMQPDYAEAHYNRGNVLQELKRFEDALAAYDAALNINPEYVEALGNRGLTLHSLKRFDDALTTYNRALAIQPNNAETHSNRGDVLRDLERYDEAFISYDRALTIKPDHVDTLFNRGAMLRDLKRYDEAIASYDRVLMLKPDHADAHHNQSLCQLLLGDFANGWRNYEWRWQTEQMREHKRTFTQPLWQGEPSLAGKTILLYGEQGYGDTLQFCRYAQHVKALGATVLLEVPPALHTLLHSLQGVDVLLNKGEPLPDFDYHCPLLSLPLAFNTDSASIPAECRYIFSPAERVKKWQAILGNKTLPRIGVAWSGSSQHKNDHNRSIPFSQFKQLLNASAQFYSLQKDLRDDEAALLANCSDIRHFGDQLHDFSDTAALCELMDIIISVDTSVAHLAGAMGKPVWILLPYNPDWRWMLDREDSA